MKDEINVNEVIEDEMVEFGEEEFEETNSNSGVLAGLALGVIGTVAGSIGYKKLIKPGIQKIKDKFAKKDESEEVEVEDEEQVEITEPETEEVKN